MMIKQDDVQWLKSFGFSENDAVGWLCAYDGNLAAITRTWEMTA